MSHNLCKEYPALSPVEVDNMAYVEVLDLYIDVRTMQIDNKPEDSKVKKKDNATYVPAGDDWF